MKSTGSDVAPRAPRAEVAGFVAGVVFFIVFSVSLYRGASLTRAAAGAGIQAVAATAAWYLRRRFEGGDLDRADILIITILACNPSFPTPDRSFRHEIFGRLFFSQFFVSSIYLLLVCRAWRRRRASASTSPLFDREIDFTSDARPLA